MKTAIKIVIGAQLGASLLMWPMLDKYLHPILDSFTILKAETDGDILSISGRLFKLRATDCRFLAVRVYDQHGDHLALKFDDNKADQAANRPRGRQVWGPWRITLKPDTKAIAMKSTHECFYVWPFRLPSFNYANEMTLQQARSTWTIETTLVPKTPINELAKADQ